LSNERELASPVADVVVLHDIHYEGHIAIGKKYDPIAAIDPSFPKFIAGTNRLKVQPGCQRLLNQLFEGGRALILRI
jgi:hypothetical protein